MHAPMQTIELDVYGKRVRVARVAGRWRVYYRGPDGTRRPAPDLLIPSALRDDEVPRYLADLCHEWATPAHPDVKRR